MPCFYLQNHEVVASEIMPDEVKRIISNIFTIEDIEIEDFLANNYLNFTATLNRVLTNKDAVFTFFGIGFYNFNFSRMGAS